MSTATLSTRPHPGSRPALPAGHAPVAGRPGPDAAGAPARSTVVVLHAHPDDEAIFTGATMRALADAGHRVVLVTATTGGAGVPRIDLHGRTLQSQRIAELEASAAVLGAHRLVVLGYGDSGAHRGPWAPGTLGATAASDVADRLTALVREEGASALVHYDSRGIYGHVDHVQVHRIGAAVVARTGVTGYEATVDRARLRTGPRHVLHGAAGDAEVGLPSERIGLAVRADQHLLAAKWNAMASHVSQIGPEWFDPTAFAAAYGREWFVRTGRPAAIDALTHAHSREAAHV